MSSKYEVGYGKPPKHTRFKPGRSGNPKGRPKKPASFSEEFLDVAGETMTISESGRAMTLPKRRALIKRIFNDALKGNSTAQRLVVGILAEAGNSSSTPQPKLSADRRKILDEYMKQRSQAGGDDDNA